MGVSLEHYRDQIVLLCRKYRLRRLELFGSAASEESDAAPGDIDLFYEFDPSDSEGLADRFFALQADLERLFGRKVDLVSARDVTNPYFLEVANRKRVTLYAA